MADEDEGADQHSGLRVTFDVDKYDYVADKGPVASVGLESDGSFVYQTFRIIGLPKGRSVPAGVPGYYFINTSAGDDEILLHPLPAILHPADSSEPPVYGLRWKIGANGQIYAMTIPTDVKLTSDADGNEKWLTEADVTPRRLNLFESTQAIENRDGQPLGKKFDQWIKSHSTFFGDIKVKSLAAAKVWCSHNKFTTQVKLVVGNAEAAITAQAHTATGTETGTTAGRGKRQKGKGK